MEEPQKFQKEAEKDPQRSEDDSKAVLKLLKSNKKVLTRMSLLTANICNMLRQHTIACSATNKESLDTSRTRKLNKEIRNKDPC